MNFSGIITTLTITAVITSIAISLTPDGKTKKAIRFVCGIVILAVALSSVAKLDLSGFLTEIKKSEKRSEEFLDDFNDAVNELNRDIIENDCRAYILDKADKMDVQLSEVTVTASWSTDGFWYPAEVKIISNEIYENKEKLEY